MDGLACAEGPFFKNLHLLDGLCIWLKEGLLTWHEFEEIKQELLAHTP